MRREMVKRWRWRKGKGEKWIYKISDMRKMSINLLQRSDLKVSKYGLRVTKLSRQVYCSIALGTHH